MATEILKQRLNNLKSISHDDQRQLQNSINAIIDGIRVLTAKLDNDAGVTDVNYTALFDAVVTK